MGTPSATVRHLFHGLKWHQATEYALLMLLALSVPLNWRLALWCLILLCANTIIRIFITRRIGNPALSRHDRICLGLMILFYFLYAVSTNYSSNPSEALSTLSTMLPLILFPLIFLLTDTSHLHRSHFDLLAYLLAAVLTLRFLVMVIRSAFHSIDSTLFNGFTDTFATLLAQISAWATRATPFEPLNQLLALVPVRATAHLFNDTPFESLRAYQFDPLHHNYLALYILTAIALLYSLLVRHWKAPRWRMARWIVVGDIALLATYVLLSDSRSGMVVMLLLAIVCLTHLTLKLRQWRTTGIILATLAVLIGASYWASPKTYQHITFTAHRMLRGEEGDIRQTMWQGGMAAIKERPLFGYGCDGYWDALMHHYRANECYEASAKQFSTHNQYLETTLATGLVGLAVLLAMIILPVLLALRRPRHNLPMILFTVVYACCLFFETTFGRQMGLLFIPFWYAILLASNTIKDKEECPAQRECLPAA